MKKLLFFALIILFISCGNNTNKNESIGTVKNEKAVNYYKKALNLNLLFTTERDSILKAVVLLDSAILIDPQYIDAYFLKLNCQTKLGEYEKALETVKIIEKINFDNADVKSLTGVYYLLNNDNITAETKLLQADSLWNSALDTVSSNNSWGILHILMNKYMVLKLLKKDTEANNTYNQILNDTTFNGVQYKDVKKYLDSMFHKTKEDILEEFKQNQYPNR